MLVGKVAIVGEQGFDRRVLYRWRCVRRGVHERKLESCAAWALNKTQITDSTFQVYLLLATSDGWESGLGPIEMLVSSVANSKNAISGTSRASEVASRGAWSTHRVDCSDTDILFSILYCYDLVTCHFSHRLWPTRQALPLLQC